MRYTAFAVILLSCLSFAPVASLHALDSSVVEVSILVPSQRTMSISKSSARSAAQARVIAERKNPGWMVVSIKERSKSWGITLKKK